MEAFPYYLSLGMTYDEYWNGEAGLATAYRKAERIREERLNQEMWLQGAYFKSALDASIGTAFGSRRIDYAKRPFALTEEDSERAEEEDRKARLEAFRDSLMAGSGKGVRQDGRKR